MRRWTFTIYPAVSVRTITVEAPTERAARARASEGLGWVYRLSDDVVVEVVPADWEVEA